MTLYDLPGVSTTKWTNTTLDSAQIGVNDTAGSGTAQASTMWLLFEYTDGNSNQYTTISIDTDSNDLYVIWLRSGTAYYNKYSSGAWGRRD